MHSNSTEQESKAITALTAALKTRPKTSAKHSYM